MLGNCRFRLAHIEIEMQSLLTGLANSSAWQIKHAEMDMKNQCCFYGTWGDHADSSLKPVIHPSSRAHNLLKETFSTINVIAKNFIFDSQGWNPMPDERFSASSNILFNCNALWLSLDGSACNVRESIRDGKKSPFPAMWLASSAALVWENVMLRRPLPLLDPKGLLWRIARI